MQLARDSKMTVLGMIAVAMVVSALVASCSPVRSSEFTQPQKLGEIVVRFDGYTRNDGVGWQAVILATNTSNMKIECVAFSYAAGLRLGSTSLAAKELEVDKLPKSLAWTRRKPQMAIDPPLMKRYGIGRVFELQPGERVRLLLPVYVPQAHSHKFVEHFAFGYKRTTPTDSDGTYETYVAEVKG